MMERLIKVVALAAVGWLVGEIATDALEAVGISKRAATVLGGAIGGMI
jgi:hypothetical protein